MATISNKTQKHIDEFEGMLRELCYEALCIKDELAEEGQKSMVDGCEIYAGEARKYQYMEHFMDEWIKDWFGGYNYPTD